MEKQEPKTRNCLLTYIKFFIYGPYEAVDGWFSWLVCGAGLCLYMCSFGLHLSFGIILNALLERFDVPRAKVAWVGAIASTILSCFALMAAPAINKFGHRTIALVGSFLTAAGLFTSSFVANVDQMFLTYSLLSGLGTSLLFLVATDLPSFYFNKYYSAAMLLTTCGIGGGGALFSQIYRHLLKRYSWKTSFQIMSLIILVLSTLPSLLLIPHARMLDNENKTKKRRAIKDHWEIIKTLFKNRSYVLFFVIACVGDLEYFASYSHLVQYAVEMGIPQDKASNIPTFMSIGNGFGRIACALVLGSAKFDKMHVLRVCLLVSGTSYFCASFGTTYIQVASLTTLATTFSGPFQGMVLAGPMWMIGPEFVTVGISLIVFSWMIPTLLASPVVGLIVDKTGNYKSLYYVAGGPLLLALFISIFIYFTNPYYKQNHVIKHADGEQSNTEKNNQESEKMLPIINIEKTKKGYTANTF